MAGRGDAGEFRLALEVRLQRRQAGAGSKFPKTNILGTGPFVFGILPAAGLTLLLGVERFMSEIRAVTNLFSNIFATVVVSKWMGELDNGHLHRVLDGGSDEFSATVPMAGAAEARA
jgi:hypothetical protein